MIQFDKDKLPVLKYPHVIEYYCFGSLDYIPITKIVFREEA